MVRLPMTLTGLPGILLTVFRGLLLPGLFFIQQAYSQVSHTGMLPDDKEIIAITGQTNLNCFTCRYMQKAGLPARAQVFKTDRGAESHFTFSIPVSELNCGNEIMEKDMKQLLRSGEHPDVFVRIKKEHLDGFSGGGSMVQAVPLEISIAGESRALIIPCEIRGSDESGWELSGEASILLTDFGLVPPEKFLGLIRVKNKVDIRFSFNFNVL